MGWSRTDNEYVDHYLKQLTGSQVKVYQVIARRAGARREAWPSHADIQAMANIGNRRTIIRAIARLTEIGLITQRRTGHHSRYTILEPWKNVTTDATTEPRGNAENVTTDATKEPAPKGGKNTHKENTTEQRTGAPRLGPTQQSQTTKPTAEAQTRKLSILAAAAAELDQVLDHMERTEAWETAPRIPSRETQRLNQHMATCRPCAAIAPNSTCSLGALLLEAAAANPTTRPPKPEPPPLSHIATRTLRTIGGTESIRAARATITSHKGDKWEWKLKAWQDTYLQLAGFYPQFEPARPAEQLNFPAAQEAAHR